MAKNLLLEIGTEELPASYIEPAREQLRRYAEEFLTVGRFSYENIVTYATPRRLALLIEQLSEKSEDRVEEMTGPSVKAGRDEKGNFTAAARGFASKYDMPVEKLSVKTTEKGEYLCAIKKFSGEKVESVLKSVLPGIIERLNFPKSMVWDESGFRFARPMRTLTALYGEKVIKFALAGVKSSDWSYGLHTLTRKKIKIGLPEKYLTVMRNNCVLADPGERKEVVKKIIESASRRIKGNAIIDAALLDEVNYLVEHPVAVLCRFEEKYLKLPAEVLVTCLKKKQKCFAIEDSKGKLTNYFIGIRNGISEHQEIVKEGYERVLSARLADAEFFFQQDTRTTLALKQDKLKGVVFQKEIGTVYEKTCRVKQIAHLINDSLSLGNDPVLLNRAADLAKADLVTNMIFEYPELQGSVGRLYAKHDGENDEVCLALEDHYWPLAGDGKLPESTIGTILSIADKIDTLVGNFAVGLEPTGSADPHGQRRMATGVLRIILEKQLDIQLEDLIEKSFLLLPSSILENSKKYDINSAKIKIKNFLWQRLENIFESAGFKYDEIRAVLNIGFSGDIIDVRERLIALKDIRSMSDFEPLAAAFKRAQNILKQADKQKVQISENIDESLFKEESEKNLYIGVRAIESDVQSLIEKKQYLSALKKMVGIKPSVDEFFDKVMVMADDEALRGNRLALLKFISSLFFNILDFSQLQG